MPDEWEDKDLLRATPEAATLEPKRHARGWFPAALLLSCHSSHFKNICEVRIEVVHQSNFDSLPAIVLYPYTLITRAFPQKLRAKEMERSPRHDHLTVY